MAKGRLREGHPCSRQRKRSWSEVFSAAPWCVRPWVLDLCRAAGDGVGGTGETLKESAKPSARELEHVFEREEHGVKRFLMDMRGAQSWACLLGLLVGGICVLQTAVYSLAGRQRAGSWAAWKRPPGSSRGKSAFEKTTNTSVGLLSLGPGGWCLRPTASTGEPCIPWCRPPSHSGSTAFPGVLRATSELSSAPFLLSLLLNLTVVLFMF